MASLIQLPKAIAKSIDDYTYEFIETTKDIFKARKYRDGATVLQGAFKHGESVSNLTYMAARIVKYLSMGGYIAEQLIIKSTSSFATLFKNVIFIDIVAGLGLLSNGFALARESISVYRQWMFTSIFKNRAWRGKGLVYGLEALNKYSESALKQLLPQWMYEDLQLRGGTAYLSRLIERVKRGDEAAIQEGVVLLERMRNYSIKKQLMHLLAWTSAITGVLIAIAIILACPPAAIYLIMALSMLASISAFLIKKGVVENPDGGFSLKYCFVPQFIHPFLPKWKPQPR